MLDGDTFRISGVVVRLHGIDAPERGQSCKTARGTAWACGDWVTQEVRKLFQGKRAICKTVAQDRYGRDVARCRVKGRDAGQVLVQAGLAFAYRRYSMAYDLDEKAAFVRGIGLHGSQVENPAAYRRSHAAGRTPPNPNCAIKGNISRSGVRIFHRPGQADYDATGINPKKGERWFCSAAEARAAGWRAARR